MLDSEYTLTKLIGRGAFGCVYLTSKNGSSIKYATKIIDKKIYKNEKAKKYLYNEIDIFNRTSEYN